MWSRVELMSSDLSLVVKALPVVLSSREMPCVTVLHFVRLEGWDLPQFLEKNMAVRLPCTSCGYRALHRGSSMFIRLREGMKPNAPLQKFRCIAMCSQYGVPASVHQCSAWQVRGTLAGTLDRASSISTFTDLTHQS